MRTRAFLILISSLSWAFFSFIAPVYGRNWPESSPYVPVDSAVYGDLDLLAAYGLLPSLIRGQKPFSRAEINRLIQEATKKCETAHRDPCGTLLSRLKMEYSDDEKHALELHALDRVDFTFTELQSPSRAYFQNTLLQASFNPLVQNEGGRHLINGSQHAFETIHWAQVRPYFSAYFQPRLQFQTNRRSPGGEENQLFIQELYGSATFFNTQIDIGRQTIHWGQSKYGGLILSNNARPLDALRISNPSPWKIPVIGYLKYSFFLANLGPEQNFKNPFLGGGKLSFLPSPYFELGLNRALIFGGQGAPSAGFLDMFGEFFGIRPGDIQNLNLSNSINGFEMRGRIPPLRNLEVYAEFAFDDLNGSHIFRSFVQDSAILAGIFIPRLNRSGTWNARVEGKKHSSIMYKNSTWTSGWALNRFILGDPLGPDAESISIELAHRLKTRTQLRYQFTFERIDSDVYQSGPSGREVATNGIPEKRFRNTVAFHHALSSFLSMKSELGYERVQNFNFASNNSRNNYLLTLGLSLDTSKHFTRKSKPTPGKD